MFRKKKGFTLIEVIVVVILVAVMAAVALPHYRVDYTTKVRMKNAVLQIVSDIRYTRRLAVTDIDANRYIIRFYFADHTYGIYRNSISQANLIGELNTIPSEITPSGQRRYNFFQLGNANYSGSGILTLTGPSYTYTISVIKATGKVTITEQ